MCTVTVVSARETFRLACNRDERGSRPAALPPRIRRFGRRRAVLPVDPASGGTWVAVNDAGLAMALLNVNPQDKTRGMAPPLRSRGAVIPALLHCGALGSAISGAMALDPRPYAPFRLLLADREELAELRSDGSHTRLVCRRRVDEPLLFTSSGLGDRLVEGPRRRLFADFFRRPGDGFARQDLFHRHRWPERPHLSVCMRRSDARTVSHTVLSLASGGVTLAYHPAAPDEPAETVSVTIPTGVGSVP